MPDDLTSTLLEQVISQALSGNQGQGTIDPKALGLFQAFGDSPFYQGKTDYSGPMGQIAHALMPLATAPMLGRQAAAEQQQERLKGLTSIATFAVELQKLKRQGLLDDATYRKTLAEAGLTEQKAKLFEDMLSGVKAGGGLPRGGSLSVGGLTLRQPEETPSEKEGRINRQAATRIAMEQRANDQALARLGIPIAGAAGGAPVAPATDPSLVLGETAPKMRPSFHVSGGKLGVTLTPDKPPKATQAESALSLETQASVGMKDQLEGVLANYPDTIPGLKKQVASAMSGQRAAEGGLLNLGESIMLGNPDPKLVPYIDAVGQFEAELSRAAAASGQRGGKYLVDTFSKHIPHPGDQPYQVKQKLKDLYAPNGILASRFAPAVEKLVKSGEMTKESAVKTLDAFSFFKDKGINPSTGHIIGLGMDGRKYDLGYAPGSAAPATAGAGITLDSGGPSEDDEDE